jgi:hypothetical protein
MSNIPDRADSRQPIRMRKQNCARGEDCGSCMKCKINADIAASGIQDDDDTTGTMGIRDNKDLRKNADNLRKGK